MATNKKDYKHFLVYGSAEQNCEDLSEAACRAVPNNFIRILSAQFFTKLADTLASTKLVLPWILGSIGAPAFLIGLLMPTREATALIPQVMIASWISVFRQRKYFFVAGCITQAVSIAAIAVFIGLLPAKQAALATLGCLVVFSIGRSFCSISSKDILGKNIPKGRRGHLNGLSASLAGAISTALGCALLFDLLNKGVSLIWLLLPAAACWSLAAWIFARIQAQAMTPAKSSNQAGIVSRFALLLSEKPLRHFVIARCLLLGSALASPYLVLLAQRAASDASAAQLGLFLLVGGIASFLSGKLWGQFADKSSRKLLLVCALFSASLCLAAALLSAMGSPYTSSLATGLFFLTTVVHQGVRVARKTYVVNMAKGNRRTTYVSLSNTIIGILLLLFGLVGALAAQIALFWLFAMFSTSAILAAVMVWRLPEA